jgi:hypothetical protein
MKMRNVGPKKITQSLLEGPARRKKRTKDGVTEYENGDRTYKVLARKDPDDLSPEEERTLKKLRRERKERRKKREHEAMLKGQAEDNRFDKRLKGKEKKISKSRELVVQSGVLDLTEKDKRRIAKQTESFFGGKSSKIMEMLEMGDSDGGITILKKTLLMTIIRVLPMSEQILSASGTEKGTYQFVTLVSQMRELMADIQADKDKQYIAQSITEQILRPAFMNLAQEMINQHHDFRKRSDMFVVPEKSSRFSQELMELGKSLASSMQVEYRDVSAKINEALKN